MASILQSYLATIGLTTCTALNGISKLKSNVTCLTGYEGFTVHSYIAS